MNDLKILDHRAYGYGFLPPEYLLPGEDEYRIRDQQLPQQLHRSRDSYRRLTEGEISALLKAGNRCGDWEQVLVSERFDPDLVRNCEFAGLVRLGAIHRAIIEHHDLMAPIGITNSRIVSCDIGDNCAIHNCGYLAHYIIGDSCLLLSNEEIHVSNHSKFGAGIVMEGESEELRVQLDIMNENGGRSILPFAGLCTADAYLWARYRGDLQLQDAFRAMTDRMHDHRRGRYGTIGSASVLKDNRIIKDVAIGEAAYIKGANKLKNLSILSRDCAKTQIGEGVELVNGIIGYGSRVFYGCKAVRFVLGSNCSLKYGARLIHSVLGDNSTVSCCEMLNNLIFPGHEQHHNTSFLIAALVRGQSNMAAGATIGSNHNSRAPDGEVETGRGFWPGLSTSIKHSSHFASFCLLSKGNYRFELNIRLPFCLVDDDSSKDRLVLAPAFWWTHNLYALMRNEGKLRARDHRHDRSQVIEYSPFAPDTAEEIIEAMDLIEGWVKASGIAPQEEAAEIRLPRRLVENSERPAVLRKPRRALAAYREMLLWYAGKAVAENLASLDAPALSATALKMRMAALDLETNKGERREKTWENLGGQLVPIFRLNESLDKIRRAELGEWSQVHAEYAALSELYPEDKVLHAWAVLRLLYGRKAEAAEVLTRCMEELGCISRKVEDGVFLTRAKDYANQFRKATFRSEAEMLAVSGRPEENSFVLATKRDMETLRRKLALLNEALAT